MELLDILGFLGMNLAKALTKKSKNLRDPAKKFKKSQDSYQEFQEKLRIGNEMQEGSRFPFRTSVIIKPSDVSANELTIIQKYQKYPALWN